MSTLNDSTVITNASVTESKKERGEGVISTAIAVLIVVSLGGIMWLAYKTTFDNANTTVNNKVTAIGTP